MTEKKADDKKATAADTTTPEAVASSKAVTEEKAVTEKRKFFNESAGIHGRGDYGGPYYDDEVNKQWQAKHGEGTWSPSTVVVDEARLKSQYNPHILPGDDARDATKVDAKPLGEFEVVTETTTEKKSSNDSL